MYFPFEYVAGLVRHLAERPDVDLIRYDDLDFDGDTDYENSYPREQERWVDLQPPDKISVLLQYDVDSNPEATARLLGAHTGVGAPVSVMIFAVPPDGDEEGYHMALRSGGIHDPSVLVGYHSNAYERSDFDPVSAQSLFLWDVGNLRGLYGSIRFWSPHGGRRDKDGQSNAFGPEPVRWIRQNMRWVHNRRTVRFKKTYSDGGIGGTRYKNERDLRKFVAEMEPGARYRILLHPQYYVDRPQECPTLEDKAWYHEVLSREGRVWE